MKLKSAIFYSNDINRAQEFYEKLLGLKVERKAGDAFISFLFDNEVRLGIKKAVEEREIPGKQTIFIEVANIEDWYSRLKSSPAKIQKPLTKESWGTEFSILDPDENKIQFVKIT